ncbi:protein TUNAR-like [Anguilla rostrata]|uniref:protein TUNAR-like n=1 Tax=Anguilla rostrata TaxID=7938 RepID=UPI0030D4A570
MLDVNLLLTSCRVTASVLRRLPAVTMGTTGITIEEVRAQEGKEEREESILALLGIVGTFLNLFVIVFVYIYTTL